MRILKLRKFCYVIIYLIFILSIKVNAESSDDRKSQYKIAYANGTYVMVNTRGEIKTSKDFKNWSDTISILDVNWSSKEQLERVKYVQSVTGEFTAINDIIWTQNKFVAVGGALQARGFEGSQIIISSLDGLKWDVVYFKADVLNYLNSITYGDLGFIAVGRNGNSLFSKDGIKWSDANIQNDKYLGSVVYAKNKYFAFGSKGVVYTSIDGVKWVTEKQNKDIPNTNIVFLNNLFISSDYGVIYTSPNGIEWIERYNEKGALISSIAWGDGQYIAVGNRGLVLVSKDSLLWTKKDINLNEWLTGVKWDGKRFVIVSGGGQTTFVGEKLEEVSVVETQQKVVEISPTPIKNSDISPTQIVNDSQKVSDEVSKKIKEVETFQKNSSDVDVVEKAFSTSDKELNVKSNIDKYANIPLTVSAIFGMGLIFVIIVVLIRRKRN